MRQLPTLVSSLAILLAAGCTTVSPERGASGSAVESSSPVQVARQAKSASDEAAPESGLARPVTVAFRDLVPAAGRVPVREGEEPRRIESSLSEEEILQLIAEAEQLVPSDRVQVIQPQGLGGGPVLGTSFDSIDVLECCGAGTLNPPDPEMAAGPNHLVAVVNASVEIYDTSGASLAGPTPRKLPPNH